MVSGQHGDSELLKPFHSDIQDGCLEIIGENFQDYSLIQDFEADFPQKVSLKMLNKSDFNTLLKIFKGTPDDFP